MKAILFLASLLAIANVFAQAPPDPSVNSDSTASRPSADENESSLKLGGYFDTYYFTNFNRPSSRNNLGSSGVGRGFDRYVDQFQLGMLMLSTKYALKDVEIVAEVGYGPNMDYASYGSDFRYKWGTVLANSTYTAILIKQAYINYRVSPRLAFTIGQFGTHIGYEYIDSPLNFHYSINNTFNSGVPFYHVGLKANYQITDNISLMAGLVNGTDNINDNNRGKSIIGQISVLPAEGLSIYLNTIQGNEANTRSNGADTVSYFGVLDLVASYQVSDNVLMSTWLMYGSLKGEYQGGTYFNESKHWSGANLYISYKVTDVFSIGTRLEYFNNNAGARAMLTQGHGTDVRTFTVTGCFSIADGHLIVKPEFRADIFKKESGIANERNGQQFMDRNGNYSLNAQSTLGVAAVFKF